ncbi:MAG: fumarylacetoacetate hydrolase family protein [Motiliproteus sp.]
MRLSRFQYQDTAYEGVIKGDQVRVVNSMYEKPLQFTGLCFALDDVQLLAPSLPSKIICAGVNYRAHQEDGHALPLQPFLFLKPPTAATATGQDIPFPRLSQRVGFEGEIAVVIGRAAADICADQVDDVILGYCCANDVSALDIQHAEKNFGTAKNFPGFAPFGPWIETEVDGKDLWLETRLNGELKQRSHCSDLVFPVDELVAYISQVMPLQPGDLILTGTPRGMGDMQPGDEVEISVSGIGTLSNRLGPQGK